MGRTPKVQYLVTAHYSIGWGDNRELLTSGFGPPDEVEAMQHASSLVDEMRRGGAATALRRVRVRKWERGGSLDDAPTLFDESYYDVAQGLSPSDAYAARVHSWHQPTDSFNARAERRNGAYRSGYSEWNCEYGPRPTSCPACQAQIAG